MNDRRAGKIQETLQSIFERRSGAHECVKPPPSVADQTGVTEATPSRRSLLFRVGATALVISSLFLLGLISGGLNSGQHSLSVNFERHRTSSKMSADYNREPEPNGPGSLRRQWEVSSPKGTLVLQLEKDPARLLIQELPRTVPELLRLFESGSPLERYCAFRVLERMGGEADSALPKLEELAHRAADDAALTLIRSVALAAPSKATPHLCRLLQSTNRTASDGSEVILATLTQGAREAKPAVLNAFHQANPDRQARLASLLWAIDGSYSETLTALIRNLEQTTDNSTIAHLLHVIGVFGKSAEAAVPVVARVLQASEDQMVCYRAARVLGQIGMRAEISVPVLVEKFLSSAQKENSLELVSALGGFGTNCVPRLVELAKGANPAVSERAIETLLRMGIDAAVARDFFRHELQSKDEKRAIDACEFFVQPGIANAADLQALQELTTSHPSPALRHMASIAVISNGLINKQTLSVLVDTSHRGFVGENEKALSVLNRVAREHPKLEMMLGNTIHRIKSACSFDGEF